jgi:hypothetical protein
VIDLGAVNTFNHKGFCPRRSRVQSVISMPL